MPKNKWSAKDERKYEHIYEACVIQARRGGEKGATKTCKRIAAATVNRDRALMGLSSCGLGSRAERGGRCVFSGNPLERAIESVGPMDGWPDNALATNQWAPVPMRWFRSKAAAEKWIAENPGDGRPKRAQNVIPPGWGMDGPKWAVYAQQFRGLGAVHPFHAPGVGVKLTAQSAADAAGDRAYYAEIGNPDNDDYRRSGPMTFDEAMARAQEYADIPGLYEDASVRHRDEAGREVHWVKRRGARGLGAAPKTTAEAIAEKRRSTGLRGTSAEHLYEATQNLRAAEDQGRRGHRRAAEDLALRANQELRWIKSREAGITPAELEQLARNIDALRR